MNKAAGPSTRGRRPGRSGTRERILDAARTRFISEGYQSVTLRAIAADAGVDVALVSYYFESKQGLFGAALALPVNPIDRIVEVLKAPDDQLAELLLRTFLGVWDNPVSGTPLRTITTAAAGDPNLNRLVRELIEREILTLVATRLNRPDGRQRAMAFAATMAGLIFSRYVFKVEPIASMPADEVVSLFTPIQNVALFAPA